MRERELRCPLAFVPIGSKGTPAAHHMGRRPLRTEQRLLNLISQDWIHELGEGAGRLFRATRFF